MRALAGRKIKKKNYWKIKSKKTKKARTSKAREVWNVLNTGWTGAIFYCVLGIIFAYSVHQASGFALGTNLPIVTVSSTSMVPTLNVGDIVIIKGEETYELNDIIVFAGWESDPIIHRVVAIGDYPDVEKLTGWNELTDKYIGELSLSYNEGKIYITKGDNNPKCDQCTVRPPVEETKVYGKAVAMMPYLGWVKILVVMIITDPLIIVRWFVKDPILGTLVIIVVVLMYVVYKKYQQIRGEEI